MASLTRFNLQNTVDIFMDDDVFARWKVFENNFHRAARNSLSYYLNAKAYDFANAVIPKIEERYTIRSRQFLKNRILVNRIKDRQQPIDEQFVAVGLNKSPRDALNFTAWAEWFDSGWNPRPYRYSRFARGGDYKNKVLKKYADRTGHSAGSGGGGEAYDIAAGNPYAALKLIHQYKTGQKTLRNAFYIADGQVNSKGFTFREGLYALDDAGKVHIVSYHDNPLPVIAWDWYQEIHEQIDAKYTPHYVLATYFEPTLARVVASINRRR
jgi:hypothetical protein